jgi:hypothetical protein
MKKFFSFAAIAAMAVAGMISCSSDDAVENVSYNKTNDNLSGVQFNVHQNGSLTQASRRATRGLPTTPSNWQDQISDFQVWGYFAPGATGTGVTAGSLYMGESATEGIVFDGTAGSYNYHDATQMAYWPATTAPLNFQAITPAADTEFTIENTPNAGLARVTAVVTVPTTCADQKDIMFAKTDNQTKESSVDHKAALNFQHGLSQIVFSGRAASENIVAEVGSIEIHNVYNTGKVGFFGSSSALTSSTTGVAGTTFVPTLLDGVGDLTINSTTAKNITADNGALLMLPQTVSKWATAPGAAVTLGAADAAHNSYLKVHVNSVTNNGVELFPDVDKRDIYIPLDIAWEQGKKYIYTIVFGKGIGGFDEDGNPLDNMLPIMFTVTTTDWELADPQPDEVEF